MEFSRPEDWSGLPFPSLGDLLNPGIKLRSPVLQVDFLPAEPPGKPVSDRLCVKIVFKIMLRDFCLFTELIVSLMV